MFLDEELLEIGRNTDLTKFDSVKKSIGKMIQICFKNLSEKINGNLDDKIILANFKRVNNTWMTIADKLESEGRGFIQRDGFKLVCKGNDEFKNLFI